MGDWGYKVYENDEAADWFASFWESKDLDLLAQEVEQFDPSEENYDTIRAVAHVLIAFGSPYACPFSFIDRLYPTMQATLVILQNMLTPPNDTWSFLDMWGEDPGIVRELEQQIRDLQELLPK